jgi:hypothetical protein
MEHKAIINGYKNLIVPLISGLNTPIALP